MKICLTGGGTAGHITPNIALLPEIRKYFDNIIYIGGINSMEKKLLAIEKDVKFYEIHTAKLVRKSVIKNLKLPINLIKGVFDAKSILKKEQPDIIFSKGGYVSVPVMMAAKKLNIPLVCHESDLSLGLANKIVSKYARVTFTSFEETAKKLKNGIYSGSPIKEKILLITKEQGLKNLGILTNKQILLITGGSLGAKSINDVVFSLLPALTKEYFVLHIIGKSSKPNFKDKNYRCVHFADNMEDYIAASDMVISRAGSNTIFELLAKNKPMLLIPLGKKGSRGDQIKNAEVFASLGYAITLQDSELNSVTLLQKLNELKIKYNEIKSNQKKSKQLDSTNIIMHYIKDIIKKT